MDSAPFRPGQIFASAEAAASLPVGALLVDDSGDAVLRFPDAFRCAVGVRATNWRPHHGGDFPWTLVDLSPGALAGDGQAAEAVRRARDAARRLLEAPSTGDAVPAYRLPGGCAARREPGLEALRVPTGSSAGARWVVSTGGFPLDEPCEDAEDFGRGWRVLAVGLPDDATAEEVRVAAGLERPRVGGRYLARWLPPGTICRRDGFGSLTVRTPDGRGWNFERDDGVWRRDMLRGKWNPWAWTLNLSEIARAEVVAVGVRDEDLRNAARLEALLAGPGVPAASPATLPPRVGDMIERADAPRGCVLDHPHGLVLRLWNGTGWWSLGDALPDGESGWEWRGEGRARVLALGLGEAECREAGALRASDLRAWCERRAAGAALPEAAPAQTSRGEVGDHVASAEALDALPVGALCEDRCGNAFLAVTGEAPWLFSVKAGGWVSVRREYPRTYLPLTVIALGQSARAGEMSEATLARARATRPPPAPLAGDVVAIGDLPPGSIAAPVESSAAFVGFSRVARLPDGSGHRFNAGDGERLASVYTASGRWTSWEWGDAARLCAPRVRVVATGITPDEWRDPALLAVLSRDGRTPPARPPCIEVGSAAKAGDVVAAADAPPGWLLVEVDAAGSEARAWVRLPAGGRCLRNTSGAWEGPGPTWNWPGRSLEYSPAGRRLRLIAPFVGGAAARRALLLGAPPTARAALAREVLAVAADALGPKAARRCEEGRLAESASAAGYLAAASLKISPLVVQIGPGAAGEAARAACAAYVARGYARVRTDPHFALRALLGRVAAPDPGEGWSAQGDGWHASVLADAGGWRWCARFAERPLAEGRAASLNDAAALLVDEVLDAALDGAEERGRGFTAEGGAGWLALGRGRPTILGPALAPPGFAAAVVVGCADLQPGRRVEALATALRGAREGGAALRVLASAPYTATIPLAECADAWTGSALFALRRLDAAPAGA